MAYGWSGGRTGFTAAQRRAVLERDPICVNCRRRHSTIADHKVNLAEGGTNTIDNGQGLCDPCHAPKIQAEAARGKARRGTRTRPAEQHPGLT